LIFDCIELRRRDGAARFTHQGFMQAQLRLARLLDRMDLRPQVIGAQEIIRDPQAACGISF
jgi:hypothetical protein